MALWTVVRCRSLCCSDGVSFAPARVCQLLTRRGLWNFVKMTTLTRRDVLSVCVCVRSCFASKAARREHQSVLPAALVDLFGVSPCLEAPSGKGQAEVEEAATEALPGSLFLLVMASQFCVAPAGQSKLRSGGLQAASADPMGRRW